MTSPTPSPVELLPTEQMTMHLTDKELIAEMLGCLRVNLLRETLIAKDEAQFWAMLNAWSAGKSAVKCEPKATHEQTH